MPTGGSVRTAGTVQYRRIGVEMFGLDRLPDAGDNPFGTFDGRWFIVNRVRVNADLLGFGQDAELQPQRFVGRNFASEFAVKQELRRGFFDLFRGVTRSAGFPIGDDDRIVRFHDQVDSPQEVWQPRNQRFPECFFHAENFSCGFSQRALHKRPQHSFGQSIERTLLFVFAESNRCGRIRPACLIRCEHFGHRRRNITFQQPPKVEFQRPVYGVSKHQTRADSFFG